MSAGLEKGSYGLAEYGSYCLVAYGSYGLAEYGSYGLAEYGSYGLAEYGSYGLAEYGSWCLWTGSYGFPYTYLEACSYGLECVSYYLEGGITEFWYSSIGVFATLNFGLFSLWGFYFFPPVGF